MAVNPNTDFTAGAVLTAAQQNRFPRGVMAIATSTSSYTLTNTLADIPGLSVTFTAAAGRLYKMVFSCGNANQTAATDRMNFVFADASNNVFANIYHGGVFYGIGVTFTEFISPTAGSTTVKARARYDLGVAGFLYADATTPMRLYVEDVGPI